MTASKTFKTTAFGSVADLDVLALATPGTPNLQSTTFYQGDKGDEVSDYSLNYQVGSTTIKNTSVFFYGTDSREPSPPAPRRR